MSEGDSTKQKRFRPTTNHWVALGAVVLIGIVGWRLQRRYLPTCGQMASHVVDVFTEADPDSKGRPGPIRQECIDGEWTMEERRALMAAETRAQMMGAWPRSKTPQERQETDEGREPWVTAIAAGLLGMGCCT
jgi:hypothetical protein